MTGASPMTAQAATVLDAARMPHIRLFIILAPTTRRRFKSIWEQGFSEYFWTRVDVGLPGSCWPWRASLNGDGYGQIRAGSRYHTAHRTAYALSTGADAGSLLVCHHCDNRPCCNPAHLYAGTKSDNERDKHLRGRTSHSGDGNPASKLTATQVAEIIELIMQGRTNTAIAATYGVHHSTISKIRTGNSWFPRPSPGQVAG